MAKMKTYAVEVEVVVKRTLFVEARKPGGAASRVLSDEGWREAVRYEDEDAVRFGRRDARVVNIREFDV